LRELPKATALILVGGTSAWQRVELPDGQTGYVAGNVTEQSTRPIRQLKLATTKSLFDAADLRAAPITSLPAGTAVQVLASAGAFQLVRGENGQTGWISE